MEIFTRWKGFFRAPWHTRARAVLFVVCLSFLAVSIPAGYADAQWWNPASWGEEISRFLVTVIIFALTAVPAFIFFVVAGITNWFIGIVFSIPIIPGSAAGNPPIFVQHGWDLLRGLANMFFLLILVFIGLATILRLREYELQRTLPRLIIAALLVNFSAVLVGFIVDISNLVANYFLSSVGGFSLGTFTQTFTLGWTFTTQLLESGAGIPSIFIGGIVYGFVMAFFFLIATLAFLAIFFIFLLRTIILWILVILSPLAFASAVLPATRGLIWNRWWSSLLQWSLVVIPISFFLWLSMSVMTLNTQDLFGTPTTPSTNTPIINSGPPGLSGAIAQFLAVILGPITGIVILFVGITISMAMAPASMRAVSNFARKAAIVGTGVLGAKAISKVVESKFGEGARKRAERMGGSTNPTWGYKDDGTKKGGLGFLARAGGGMVGYGRRSTGKVVQDRFVAHEESQKEKARRKAAQQTAAQNESDLLQADSKSKKAGIIEAMQQKSGQVRHFLGRDGLNETEKQQRALLFADAHKQYLLEGNEDAAGKTMRNVEHDKHAMGQIARQEDEFTAHADDQYADSTGGRLVDSDGKTYRDQNGNIVNKDQAMPLPSGISSEEWYQLREFHDPADPTQIYRAKGQKSARNEQDMRDFMRRNLRDEQFKKRANSTKVWGVQQQSAFMRAFGQQGVQAFEEEAQKKTGGDYGKPSQREARFDPATRNVYYRYGDDLATARTEIGTGAQGLGLAPKEGAERTADLSRHQQIARKFADMLNGIQDGKLQEEVREEVQGILDEMTDLNSKQNVINMIAEDPDLRSIFQGPDGIQDERARSEVAQALSQVQNNTLRKDLAPILQHNPELSHVTPQLAGIADQTQRQEVAGLLQQIENSDTRSGTASILQKTPEVTKAGGELHEIASKNQQLTDFKNRLKRNQEVRKLKQKRREDTSVEDGTITRMQQAIENTEKELNTVNKEHDETYRLTRLSGNADKLIPAIEDLEGVLSRPKYYTERDEEDGDTGDATGGAAPTDGDGPSGDSGGSSSDRDRRRRRTPPPNRRGPRRDRGDRATNPSPTGASPPPSNAGTAKQPSPQGNSPGPRGPAPQSETKSMLDLGRGVQVLDMFDKFDPAENINRRVFVVRMPDGNVRPFYRSSGKSTPGQKLEGDINPFGGWLEQDRQVGKNKMRRGWFVKGKVGGKGELDFAEEAQGGRIRPVNPQLRGVADQIQQQANLWNQQEVSRVESPEEANERLREFGVVMKDEYINPKES